MVSPVVFLGWMKMSCGMFFQYKDFGTIRRCTGIDQFAPELRRQLNETRKGRET